jgi:hypothetical protein
MSKLTKNIISFVLIFVFAVSAVGVFAQTGNTPPDSGDGITVPTVPNLAEGDLEGTAVNLINTLLGLLGLIALVMILIGGFKWMTSGGNEEKVGEAKKLLGAGVVGLIIILAAYAIATYVVGTIGGSLGDSV